MLKEIHLVVHFYMVGEMACYTRWGYTWLVIITKSFTACSGTQKETDRKIRVKEVWKGSIWIDLWEWAWSMQIFVPQINAHQRRSSTVEAFNNQVKRTNNPGNVRQLSCLSPQCLHKVPIKWVVGIAAIHKPPNMDLLLLRLVKPLS